LDISMPKMDGITMAKKLKEAKIASQIIFLTNMKDDGHISEAMEAVPKTEYIIKSDMNLDSILGRIKIRLNLK
jgi:DNA-binding NarL/FixJ family response regulator